jgi:glycosyltransferase involved in cell wall biosynthesis
MKSPSESSKPGADTFLAWLAGRRVGKRAPTKVQVQAELKKRAGRKPAAARIESLIERTHRYGTPTPKKAAHASAPELSIIVPVYNTKSYLDECIVSLRNQTLKDIEIILVDDHSPDTSADIVLKHMLQDERVHYIRPAANQGLLRARQVGVSIARGEYLAHVDSDDYLNDDIYKTCINMLRQENADVVQFSMQKLVDRDRVDHPDARPAYKHLELEQIFSAFLNRDINFSVCNKVYRRSLWLSQMHKFPRSSFMVEDLSQNLHLLRAAKKYISIDKVGYIYRITEGSDSRAATIDSIGFRAYSAARHVAFLKTQLKRDNLLIRYMPLLANFEKSIYVDYVRRVVRAYNTAEDQTAKDATYHWLRKIWRVNGYLPLRNYLTSDTDLFQKIASSLDDRDKEAPALTVVVPVFNIEDYLDDCLKSLAKQTLQDMEVLVVNDASTDNSAAIIDKWSRKDRRIRRIDHQVNKGLLQSRLTGVRQARGKYIGHADGDDWVDPVMFERMIEKVVEEKADIVQCGYSMVYPQREKQILAKTINPKMFTDVLSSFLDLNGVSNSMWNKICRREIWISAMPYLPDITYKAEDLCQNTYLTAMSTKLVHIGEPFYKYRIRAESGDRNQSAQNIGSRVVSACYNIQNLRYAINSIKNNSDMVKGLDRRKNGYLRSVLSTFRSYSGRNPFFATAVLNNAFQMCDLELARFVSKNIIPDKPQIHQNAIVQTPTETKIFRLMKVILKPLELAAVSAMATKNGKALYKEDRQEYLEHHRFRIFRVLSRI